MDSILEKMAFLWQLTSSEIILQKFSCTFLLCRTRIRWNLSPAMARVSQWWKQRVQPLILRLIREVSLNSKLGLWHSRVRSKWPLSQLRITKKISALTEMRTKTNTPQKGTQLGCCCAPVGAVRLHEVKHLHLFHLQPHCYLKSVNASPPCSRHLQISLLWLMAVQFVDSVWTKRWCQRCCLAFFRGQPTEKVEFGLKKGKKGKKMRQTVMIKSFSLRIFSN